MDSAAAAGRSFVTVKIFFLFLFLFLFFFFFLSVVALQELHAGMDSLAYLPPVM